MSAYIQLLLPMTDRECFLAALADLGLDATEVESKEPAASLSSVHADKRHPEASIVIRRKKADSTFGEIHFFATSVGYQASISDYDRTRFGTEWLAKLNARYKAHMAAKIERIAEEERKRLEEERRRVVEVQRQAVIERAKNLGYTIKETREGEKLRLVLVKRTY